MLLFSVGCAAVQGRVGFSEPGVLYEGKDATWQPGGNELLVLDRKLLLFIEETPASAHVPGGPTDKLKANIRAYGRQYVPDNVGGRLQIKVHGFCRPVVPPVKLRRMELAVDDGGDCFFDALYDVRQQLIVQFSTNGTT